MSGASQSAKSANSMNANSMNGVPQVDSLAGNWRDHGMASPLGDHAFIVAG